MKNADKELVETIRVSGSATDQNIQDRLQLLFNAEKLTSDSSPRPIISILQFRDQDLNRDRVKVQGTTVHDSKWFIQALRINTVQQSDHANCKLLVHRSLISLDISFRQEIYQAIQDDDFYASILYELENGY